MSFKNQNEMITDIQEFQKVILQGIPDDLPEQKAYDREVNHAPIRPDVISKE